MKVIFLDFDGVLTTSKNYGVLDPEKMDLLWKLVINTGANIVISSSWRALDVPSTIYNLTLGKDYTNTPLKWLSKVVGVTPRPNEEEFLLYDEWSREGEIKKYLECHPEIENFIILDDMEDEFEDPNMIGRLVKTDITSGLTEDHVRNAIKLLNRDENK